jgi:nucleotide-binding universal stress UspA family protein
VRFIGGGLAPFAASKLASNFNVHVPFYLGAVTVVGAIVVLATGHTLLTRADQGPGEELTVPDSTIPSQEAAIAASHLEPIVMRTMPEDEGRPIVAAIDASSRARGVTDTAIDFARLLDRPIEILHIIETDVLEELAIELETLDAARAVVTDNVDRLRDAGVSGSGHLLGVVGGHGDAGRHITEFADAHQAEMIIIGTPGDSAITEIFDASLTSELVHHARCAVHIVAPGDEHEMPRAGVTAD